jgi:uncharacterized delta-60 repeat protein
MSRARLTAAISLLGLAFAGVAAGAAGDLDPSFGSGGKVLTDVTSGDDFATSVAIDKSRCGSGKAACGAPSLKFVAAGTSGAGGSADFSLARYKSNGSLDPSFGNGGKVLTNFGAGGSAAAYGAVVQPDGKIVAAGNTSVDGNPDFGLARYKSNGSLDPSFGTGGKVRTDFASSSDDRAFALALQPDGKIVVGGSSTAGGGSADLALARYNANGSLDASFGSGGKVLTDFGSSSADAAFALALQSDGKIVTAGYSTASGNLDFGLARFNANGSLDASFGSGGAVVTDFSSPSSDQAFALALQPDGKILAAGDSAIDEGLDDFALARYDIDGSLDASFGSGGKVLTDFGSSSLDYARAVALLPDGRIVAVGLSEAGGSDDFALARYTPSGALDTSLGSGGTVLTDFGSSSHEEAWDLVLQPDGRIVAAGDSDAGGTFDFALARYLGN